MKNRIFITALSILINVITLKIAHCQEQPTVGAIRWDAWEGGRDYFKNGLKVEHSLSPQKYHYRAPFFSKVINEDSIQCREVTQSIMDQDIAYAKYSGINYWAFCWYHDNGGFDTALTLYLNSSHKNDVNWCLIVGIAQIDLKKQSVWLMNRFKEPNYQKVMNGRPLIYIFGSTGFINSGDVAYIRTLAKNAGQKNPYFVYLCDSYKNEDSLLHKVGAEAISRYSGWGGRGNGGAYFPAIPDADHGGWEKIKAEGLSVTPWVTTGKNMMPRIERPMPWQKLSPEHWMADAKPVEIANNLKNAIEWVKSNKSSSPANTILMYAWNEFDEGGWICPTLGNIPGKIDSERIKALRAVLK